MPAALIPRWVKKNCKRKGKHDSGIFAQMHAARVFRSHSAYEAAAKYAYERRLPLGAVVEVTDIRGKQHKYVVSRSALSRGKNEGGFVQLGSFGKVAQLAHGTYTIHASCAEDAARLYAIEMGNHLGGRDVEVGEIVNNEVDFSSSKVFRPV